MTALCAFLASSLLALCAGLCTSGLGKGLIGESDTTVWKIVDGKLYLCSTAERMPTDMQAAETVVRAKQIWDKRK